MRPIFLMIPLFLITLFSRCSYFVDPAIDALADYRITSITISPKNPSTADTITWQVTVKNCGKKRAEAVSVLSLKINTIPAIIQNYSVGALAPDSMYRCIFKRRLSVSQTYSITFTADIDTIIQEADETNNDTTMIITVSPPGVTDLVIDTIRLFPANPFVNDTFTVAVVIRNKGTGPTETSCMLGLQIKGDTVMYRVPVPVLPSSQITTCYLKQTVSIVQQYTFYAYSDIDNDINEINESNNAGFATFSVLPQQLPDLIIDSLFIEPDSATVIDTISLSALVKNNGAGIAKASTVTLQIAEASFAVNFPLPGLFPGTSYMVTAKTILKNSQRYTLSTIVDSANVIQETSDSNNLRSLSFTIAPSPPSDLVIDTIYCYPDNPSILDSIQFIFVARNIGRGVADSSKVLFTLGPNIISKKFLVPMLKQNQNYAEGFIVLIPDTGNYPITATADVDSSITESSEINNSRSQNLLVTPPLPDLLFDSVVVTPQNPLISDTVSIKSFIRNNGKAAMPRTCLFSLKIERDTVSTLIGDTIPLLAVDSTCYIVTKFFPLNQGYYFFTVILDSASQVTESNESNNRYDDSFFINHYEKRRNYTANCCNRNIFKSLKL